jgi:hypothetical protein
MRRWLRNEVRRPASLAELSQRAGVPGMTQIIAGQLSRFFPWPG